MNHPLDIQANIESILFIEGVPVTEKKLASVLGVSPKAVTEALESLAARYEESTHSGLKLLFHKGAVSLTTKPGQAPLIDLLIKETLQVSLTKTQLEVLAIIAYRGPVSRPEIEAIRGVNCSFTLRNLLLRELIEREGNPSNLRGFVYTLSAQFLMTLGLSSLSELPDYTKLREDEKLIQALESSLVENTESHES